jgi:ABC-type transporter Mla subunit MlaD
MRAFQGPSRTELAGTIRGFSETVDGLARERDSLGPLLRGAAQTIRAVRTQSGRPLDQTLTALPPAFAASATGGLALQGIIDRLDPLAVELSPGMRQLAPLLSELRPLLRDARPVLDRAPGFVTELSGALRSGASASAPTATMLRLLDPTLVILRDGLLPFFRGRSRAGIPVYQQLPGFGASAGASMSPVRSMELAQAQRTGSGHAWHLYSASGSGFSGPPACSTLPDAIRIPISGLGLCRP